jgi:hypothetical protein
MSRYLDQFIFSYNEKKYKPLTFKLHVHILFTIFFGEGRIKFFGTPLCYKLYIIFSKVYNIFDTIFDEMEISLIKYLLENKNIQWDSMFGRLKLLKCVQLKTVAKYKSINYTTYYQLFYDDNKPQEKDYLSFLKFCEKCTFNLPIYVKKFVHPNEIINTKINKLRGIKNKYIDGRSKRFINYDIISLLFQELSLYLYDNVLCYNIIEILKDELEILSNEYHKYHSFGRLNRK